MLVEMMKRLNKILKIYSIYNNGNKVEFIEKVKSLRDDTFYNIYSQVKHKIKINDNNINNSILIECLKINDTR